MSHNTTVRRAFENLEVLKAAAERLGWKVSETDEVRLYGANRASCVFAIHPEGWEQPIAVKEDGTIVFDYWFVGASGPKDVQRLKNTYADERMVLVAKEKQGKLSRKRGVKETQDRRREGTYVYVDIPDSSGGKRVRGGRAGGRR